MSDRFVVNIIRFIFPLLIYSSLDFEAADHDHTYSFLTLLRYSRIYLACVWCLLLVLPLIISDALRDMILDLRTRVRVGPQPIAS